MVMGIDTLTRLCPGVLFDWRLYAERGSPRYFHNHDGRCDDCELAFINKMSDDERLSLTTAISDDDDGETRDSPYKAKSGAAAAAFQCTGAVRKAGFLSVKKWLLRKRHQVELARKRGWKGYWVCLKGTTLLFYPCDSRDGRAIESQPRHLIIIDGAIMQPIPEHPKRDFIFCLSTAFGDAYLFQAPCSSELDHWISAIHNACGSAFARHRGKSGTLSLLQGEIHRLEKCLENLQHDENIANTDPTQDNHLDFQQQMEMVHCEIFRLRCYIASILNAELPNPKTLLAHVSKSTKTILNKLGVFTVSSFHAYICARSPSMLTNIITGRRRPSRRAPSRTSSSASLHLPSLSQTHSSSTHGSHASVHSLHGSIHGMHNTSTGSSLSSITVRGPNGPVTIPLSGNETVEDILWSFDSPNDYYLCIGEHIPNRSDRVSSFPEGTPTILPKVLYQAELTRTGLDVLFGFSVEAELVENGECDELAVFVSRVEEGSLAEREGLKRGDEIMVINGAVVGDLDMMFIESVLQEELCLCMMLRSSRKDAPKTGVRSTDEYIESLVCPPPPSDGILDDEAMRKLIVPSPLENNKRPSLQTNHIQAETDEIAESLIRNCEQVTNEYCSSPQIHTSQLQYHRINCDTNRELRDARDRDTQESKKALPDLDRMKKIIKELVDTERIYVQHLTTLLQIYLLPLQSACLLPPHELSPLISHLTSITSFQSTFLTSLESSLQLPSSETLVSIANTFLSSLESFKLYASFSGSHSRLSKLLSSPALTPFLSSISSGQQSTSLESYLIKPIQRVLKYPLLLNQLKTTLPSESAEAKALNAAVKGMERVAGHINEMTRIQEEYGVIFDHLMRARGRGVSLCPSELLYYGGVDWVNMSEYLGKVKRPGDLHAMCFVFKGAVVFLCKERIAPKKKLSASSKICDSEIIRYQVCIPVSEVQVQASTSNQAPANSFVWELIHLKVNSVGASTTRRTEKVYQLSNSKNEFRNAFLRTIRQIIRESVRKMGVPKSGKDEHSVSTSETKMPSKSNIKSKTKPVPPPRAPTTVKTSSSSSSKTENGDKSKQDQHGTVSCGLCGADVGLGVHEGSKRNEEKIKLTRECSIDASRDDHKQSQ